MLFFKFIKFLSITFFFFIILIAPFYNKKIYSDKSFIHKNFAGNYFSNNIKEKIKKKSFNKIIQKNIHEIKNGNKTTISVSYATDEKYSYPTIVSMTSLVYNADNDTFYNIYILHPPDFTEKSKAFLFTVQEKYSDRCSIIFFNMEDKYKDLSFSKKFSTPVYYRLSLPEILPDLDKIIYLDSDTLVFEDLKELIQINMEGNVIMGFLDSSPYVLKDFGFENATVLNSGVLLMNLDYLRKYDYIKKIEDFIDKNKNRLYQEDQTIINVVMQDKIAPLPPKYGIWAIYSKQEKKEFLDRQLPHLKYKEEDFLYASEHPAILHFIWPKPFWKLYTIFYNKWWDYAKLTGFFWEIYTKSPIQK